MSQFDRPAAPSNPKPLHADTPSVRNDALAPAAQPPAPASSPASGLGSPDLFESVLEHAPMGFAVYSAITGEPLYVNRRFADICGVEHGALRNRRDVFAVIFAEAEERAQTEARVTADIAAAPDKPHRWHDLQLTLRSGERRWLTSDRIPLESHQLILSAVQDVTDRHTAAEALRDQAERLQEQNTDLARFNRAAVDRELRMVELKREVDDLLAMLGMPARYGTRP